jgi:hypothetical protein
MLLFQSCLLLTGWNVQDFPKRRCVVISQNVLHSISSYLIKLTKMMFKIFLAIYDPEMGHVFLFQIPTQCMVKLCYTRLEITSYLFKS